VYVHGYSGPGRRRFLVQEGLEPDGCAGDPAAEAAHRRRDRHRVVGCRWLISWGDADEIHWWLWHPVGLCHLQTWSMEKLWFCLFLGRLAKSLITRYGVACLPQTMPFFIGWSWASSYTGSLLG
jgi:hypothetical protein